VRRIRFWERSFLVAFSVIIALRDVPSWNAAHAGNGSTHLEDSPWWVRALLVVAIPVGFSIAIAVGMGAISWLSRRYYESMADSLQRLGLSGGIAGFLALFSPILVLILLGGLSLLIRRPPDPSEAEDVMRTHLRLYPKFFLTASMFTIRPAQTADERV